MMTQERSYATQSSIIIYDWVLKSCSLDLKNRSSSTFETWGGGELCEIEASVGQVEWPSCLSPHFDVKINLRLKHYEVEAAVSTSTLR